MKSRHGSFLNFLMAAPALMAVACSSSGNETPPDGGGNMMVTLDPDALVSNFEDPVAATVVNSGSPPRNGYWYSYNDGSTGCVQMPRAANKDKGILAEAPYVPTAPSSFPMNGSGTNTLALHTTFSGCATWGAGVGGDLNQPAVADGGIYEGSKVEYDIGAYTGLVFWAKAEANSENHLRVKVNMSDETKEVDGGKCKEDGVAHQVGKCSDAYGQLFTLPTNGNWSLVRVKFADRTKFKQEGWGDVFPWTPAHAVSIQVQSTNPGESYDFWIDDVYFTVD
jgi:hypothetical protein